MLHDATVIAEPPAIEIEAQVALHDQFVEVRRTGTATNESRNGKKPSHLRATNLRSGIGWDTDLYPMRYRASLT